MVTGIQKITGMGSEPLSNDLMIKKTFFSFTIVFTFVFFLCASNERTAQAQNAPFQRESKQDNPSTTTAQTTADGVNDFGACNAVAKLVCPEFFNANWVVLAEAKGYITGSWKSGFRDCLTKNEEFLPADCIASLYRRDKINDDLMTTCGPYCAGIPPAPGTSAPCVTHLLEIQSTLDATCLAALEAHENAKNCDGECK